MDPFPRQKAGLFRPRVPRRIPRQIPDHVFNELFARLPSHRDRALVAFWVSTGARASELLGASCSGADPGQQLITVIRKGSRAMQQLPASPDAFVWLRLYQQEMHGLVPSGPDEPVVVDAAAAVPAAGLSRGPGDVRPGERRGRRRMAAAFSASHGGLPPRA